LPEEYRCPICNAAKEYFQKEWEKTGDGRQKSEVGRRETEDRSNSVFGFPKNN
jgi:hypothetical protein